MADPAAIAKEVESGLRAVATSARAESEKRYLKSDLHHFGAIVPATRMVVRDTLKAHGPLDREGALGLAAELWREPVHELRQGAVIVLARHVRLLLPADLAFVEGLIRESRTWALVDELATHVAGSVVERNPAETGATLNRWAKDDDFWVRRAAMLALLLPLRAGGGDWERFTRYADAMLDEREFFIRKAIGWILREVSKKRPALVAGWIEPRATRASGVTIREAVKYLDAGDRERILSARRAG